MNILPKLCNAIFYSNEPSNNTTNIENNLSNHLNPRRVYPQEEEKIDIESNPDETINRISDAESENLIIVQPHYRCYTNRCLSYIVIAFITVSVMAIIHYIDYAMYN